jgi:hypothetical protein
MTIRNRFLGGVASILIAFTIATILILFWDTLTIIIQNINVGLLMFFEQGFYTFVFFVGGLILIVGILIRFALLAKWGSRN